MKKLVTLLLMLSLALSLCACKSSDVKAVEAQIDTLSSSSTLEEIHDVYTLYSALPLKDQDKVENLNVLSDYCNPLGGAFKLSDTMVQEIQAELDPDNTISSAQIAASFDLSSKSMVEGWSDVGDINLASHKKTDIYTYTIFGTCTVVDEYGKSSRKEFQLHYNAEFSAEEPTGYTLTHYTTLF